MALFAFEFKPIEFDGFSELNHYKEIYSALEKL